MKRVILSLIILSSTQAYALEAADYADMAKNRSYTGGAEESDLRILPESYFQKNKKNNSEEVDEGF